MTKLQHITWDQLGQRYVLAQTREERLGLLHATRTAIIAEGLGDNHESRGRAAVRAAECLTNIGSEISRTEKDTHLRTAARQILARSIANATTARAAANAIDEQSWEEQTIIIRYFLAASPLHIRGVDPKDRKALHHRVVEIDRSARTAEGVQALVHSCGFEVIKKYRITEAIPGLYRLIWSWITPDWRDTEPSSSSPELLYRAWDGISYLENASIRRIRTSPQHNHIDVDVRCMLGTCGSAIRRTTISCARLEDLHDAARTLLELLAIWQDFTSTSLEEVKEAEALSAGMRAETKLYPDGVPG
ncbi:hypothetical protein HY632_01735 [Candidatus Uhrbacteria bacterium]|nr:hypothetical protein [Candidatus Uhrbacteria bacterium]